jgi:hypothetical protein
MTSIASRTRVAAGVVALVGLTSLSIQFSVSLGKEGSAGGALWAMLRFFTIIANSFTMIVMAAVALNVRAAATPRVIGCVTLTMMLVGVVYATLLRGLEQFSGAADVANSLHHYVMPVLVMLFWLVFAPRGLRWLDPARWALLPLAYLPYALARAAQDGRYAYPFIDADRLGWTRVFLNAAGIALGFLLAGVALVWLDRVLSRKTSAQTDPSL